MQQSGFASAPLTRTILYSFIAASLLASVSSTKHYFHVQLAPHLTQDHQFFRLLIFQSLYANSGEILFAALLLYQLRVVERLFGSRKFGSVVLYAYGLTCTLAPLVLFLGWLLTGGRWNYIPPGPTPVLFSLLAQYHAAVPTCYKFAMELGEGLGKVTLSDKWFIYVLAGQLVCAQLPGSALGALVGWVVGYAWRLEALPGTRWRAPGWVVRLGGGEEGAREFEGLRARLRGEEGSRREGGVVWRVLDQFRGA